MPKNKAVDLYVIAPNYTLVKREVPKLVMGIILSVGLVVAFIEWARLYAAALDSGTAEIVYSTLGGFVGLVIVALTTPSMFNMMHMVVEAREDARYRTNLNKSFEIALIEQKYKNDVVKSY